MMEKVADATNAELLELFVNRGFNDSLFIEWVNGNGIPHIKTNLEGVVESFDGLSKEIACGEVVGQQVAALYNVADTASSIEKVVHNIQAFYRAGRIGVTVVKVERSCVDAAVADGSSVDMLVIPTREQGVPGVFWIEVKAITSGEHASHAKAWPQVFAITDLDMVMLTKKAYNLSERNGFFALKQPIFEKSKFSQNGTFTHAIRLTESWSDYLEFTQDDGCVDVYKTAVRQLFDEQGKLIGHASVSRLANGKGDQGKLLAALGPVGYNRRIIDHEELKESIGDSIEKSLAVNIGFSLILLEITFDPAQKNDDEQARAKFVKNLLTRLQKIIRRNDVISGISLSKFVVVLKNVTSPDVVGRIAEYFKNVFSESNAILAAHPHIKLNGGCASYPQDGSGFSDLMEKAGVALELSKLQVGSEIYQWNNVSEHVIDHQISRDLTEAFERDELHLTFQPQIDFYGPNLVRGVEIFPGWDHPLFGKIPAAKILQLAESHGFVCKLGEWILNQSFKSMETLKREFGDGLTLSVGVACPQILEKSFVSRLIATAQAAKVNPKHICLEIPDSIDMESQSQAASALGELKTMGFKLSIDNFGINNFNFLQLSKTPIDVLKIDKSFVEDVSLNEKNVSIIRCIINMAHALGLDVISGGAESFEQINTLYRNGCYVFQGTLTGKPMTLLEMVRWKEKLSDITAMREKIYSLPQLN